MKITFFAYLFYVVVAILENLLIGAENNFKFSVKHIVWVLIFSEPSNVPGQLWFLFSLLNVYIIYVFFDIIKARKIAYIFGTLMLFTLMFLAQGIWFLGNNIEPVFYRNGFVEGFGFFMLGQYLHEKENHITISNNILIVLILTTSLLSIIERFLIGRPFGVHLSTYPLVTSIFIYALKNGSKHKGLVQKIGNRYSMYVYILHIFFWHYLDKLLESTGMENNMIAQWLRPLIVLSLTLLASMGCYALFSRKKTEQIIQVSKKP